MQTLVGGGGEQGVQKAAGGNLYNQVIEVIQQTPNSLKKKNAKRKEKKGGEGTVSTKATDELLRDPEVQEEKQANKKTNIGEKATTIEGQFKLAGKP